MGTSVTLKRELSLFQNYSFFVVQVGRPLFMMNGFLNTHTYTHRPIPRPLVTSLQVTNPLAVIMICALGLAVKVAWFKYTTRYR